MLSRLVRKLRHMFDVRHKALCAWIDYRKYAASLSSFRRIAKNLPPADKGSLLIVSGRGMDVLLAQIWTILSLAVRVHGYEGLVLTSHAQEHLNRYYRLLGLNLVCLDDLTKTIPPGLPDELSAQVQKATTFEALRDLTYQEAPIGQIALSTYSRYLGTGVIDLTDPKALEFVREWIGLICQAMQIADIVFERYAVKHLFFTEVFMEEYGAFYYSALSKGLNVTRFAGTVRDDAIIVQHLGKSNDRQHHASLSPSTWQRIRGMPLTPAVEAALRQNFLDRYGDKWHRSKRNYPNTRIVSVEEARRLLGVAEGRKVAVIYSHILYDTLFFFGTDLFDDYAQWLVESVRVACENPSVDWLVKVHPSNLWRGELDTLLRGKYEEERLLENAFGELPPHVRIVRADTPVNPYTWFQLADYGITVRGTAGLEMAALGKTVITAGTGRYEGNGFTVDPADKEEYLRTLRTLPDVPAPTTQQVELAKRYAYAIFALKPFTLQCMKPVLRTGVKEMRASDDLAFVGVHPLPDGHDLPPDLQRLANWVVDSGSADLLADWDS